MAYECSDMPFCSALMAKVLVMIKEKQGLKWEEYFIKFDEDEEEDEFYLMEAVFQKAFHYSGDQDILKFVEEKKNLTKLL